MHAIIRRLLKVSYFTYCGITDIICRLFFNLIFNILRYPVLSRHFSWLLLSWRLGTSALPCSTAKKPSRRQSEPSLTPRCSTSSTSLTIRSLPSTYRSSCPCVCLFCCHCSKSCLSLGRGAERNKPRRTESRKNMK